MPTYLVVVTETTMQSATLAVDAPNEEALHRLLVDNGVYQADDLSPGQTHVKMHILREITAEELGQHPAWAGQRE